jgi:hypothetical protein
LIAITTSVIGLAPALSVATPSVVLINVTLVHLVGVPLILVIAVLVLVIATLVPVLPMAAVVSLAASPVIVIILAASPVIVIILAASPVIVIILAASPVVETVLASALAALPTVAPALALLLIVLALVILMVVILVVTLVPLLLLRVIMPFVSLELVLVHELVHVASIIPLLPRIPLVLVLVLISGFFAIWPADIHCHQLAHQILSLLLIFDLLVRHTSLLERANLSIVTNHPLQYLQLVLHTLAALGRALAHPKAILDQFFQFSIRFPGFAHRVATQHVLQHLGIMLKIEVILPAALAPLASLLIHHILEHLCLMLKIELIIPVVLPTAASAAFLAAPRRALADHIL